jgi:hypothetical protein
VFSLVTFGRHRPELSQKIDLAWWLKPVILATQAVEIRRIVAPGQPQHQSESWVCWHTPPQEIYRQRQSHSLRPAQAKAKDPV